MSAQRPDTERVDSATPAARPWLAVAAAGCSTFAAVTTEMLPVGLLTPMAESLGTSVGTAGLALSVSAILAALFAPIVVLAAGGVDRRRILCGLLVLLTAANVLSAVAPSIGWLLASRVVVGFCIGGIWAVAGGLASRLVPERSVGVATSIIFAGIAVASVLGVPLGAMIGELAGWRMAFGAAAGMSLAVLAMAIGTLPALPVRRTITPHLLTRQFANPRVRDGLIITFLIVAGHFMAFTYVRPMMQTLSGIGGEWIGMLLLGYGLAGIAGNLLAGVWAARRVDLTTGIIAFGVGATILAFGPAGDSPQSGAMLLLLWGAAYGGVSVTVQTWMMKASPDVIEASTALNTAIFNAAIAFGAFAGGHVVDAVGMDPLTVVAGALPLLALATVVLSVTRAAGRTRSAECPCH